MKEVKQLNGIILAGGKSSRMGTEKGLLNLQGMPFVNHIIRALKPHVDNIYIVSDNPVFDRFEAIRVPDIVKNYGPVGGLYSGLSISRSQFSVVLSCDIPLINETVLITLINNKTRDADVIQLESMGHSLPLIALYNQSCLAHFKQQIQLGERRLKSVLANLKVKTICLDPALAPAVVNINTKSEYESIIDEIDN